MNSAAESPTGSNTSPPLSRAQRIARKRAVFQATVLENPWIPEHIKEGLFPKQVEFLCYEGREALYGGSAGGGKSVALLVAALQYVEEPGYSALILRRTYKQLAKADSILSKAKEWLLNRPGVRWRESDHKFTFPSGATLEFGHMNTEADALDYQGGSWPFVAPDETTQFSEKMIGYPKTRQRRPKRSKIPIRWRGATNPGGIGHEFIKTRFVKREDGTNPQTPDRQFFPARLSDNPHIDQADYVTQLKDSGIDGILLAQLLNGDWDAVAGGRFQREWFGGYRRDRSSPDYVELWRDGKVVERFNWTHCTVFQTCDPAASASSAADFFVLSTWLVSPKGNVLWWGCERDKLEIQDQVLKCQASYRRHAPAFLAIEELMNQRSLAQLLRASPDPVMSVLGVTPGGKKKLEHALAAIVLCSTFKVYLPEDNPMFPLDDVVAEVTRFTGNENLDANDDIVDTLSYMAQVLPWVGGGGSGDSPPVFFHTPTRGPLLSR